LIRRAEGASFEVFLTSDENLSYQQNLKGRNIALLVLSTNYWPALRGQKIKIQAELATIQAGEYRSISF